MRNIVQLKYAFRISASRGEVTAIEPGHCAVKAGSRFHGRIVPSLPKVQMLLGILTRQRQLTAKDAIPTLDVKHIRTLRRLVELLTELARRGLSFQPLPARHTPLSASVSR